MTTFLLLSLGFSLLVVLGEVAVLAEAVGVVGSVDVLALGGHLRFAFTVVAVVAHVLRILLLVHVGTGVRLVVLARVWHWLPSSDCVSKEIPPSILTIENSLT